MEQPRAQQSSQVAYQHVDANNDVASNLVAHGRGCAHADADIQGVVILAKLADLSPHILRCQQPDVSMPMSHCTTAPANWRWDRGLTERRVC